MIMFVVATELFCSELRDDVGGDSCSALKDDVAGGTRVDLHYRMIFVEVTELFCTE